MEAKSKIKHEFGQTSTPFHSNTKNNFHAENEISSIVAVEKKKKLIVLVVEAIKTIGHPRKGASYQAIKKWIINLQGNETNSFNRMLKLAVTKGLANGELVRPSHCLTAVGITGSFKLPKNDGVKKPPKKTVKPSENKASSSKEKQTHEKPKGKKVAQVTGKKVPAKPVVAKVTGKKTPTESAATTVTGKKAPAKSAATTVTGKKASAKSSVAKVTGKKAPAKFAVTKVTGKKASAKSVIAKATKKIAPAKSVDAKLTGKKAPAKSATVSPVKQNLIFSNSESEEEDEENSTDVSEKHGIKTVSKQLSKPISDNKKPVTKMDSLETKAKQTSRMKKGESSKKNTKDNTEKEEKTFDVEENAKRQPKKKDASQLGQTKVNKKDTAITADGKTSKAPGMKKLYAPNQRRKDLSDTELDTTSTIHHLIPLKSYSSDTELEISKRKDLNSKKSTKTRERKMPGKNLTKLATDSK